MASARKTITSAAASTNGFAAGVSGATWALSTTTPGDDCGHLVTILNNTANSHAAKTITIVGTDENGNGQTESGIAGPAGNSTVTSTKYFKTVTSITPSASIGADTFDLGWAAGSRSSWYQPDTSLPMPFNIGVGVNVTSGTPNYSLVYAYTPASGWFTHATITGKTAAFDGVVTNPCRAMAIQFTAAGAVVADFVQQGGR